MNLLKLVVVGAFALFLISCASARVDFVDPELSPTTLKAKRLAVGGVVIAERDLEFSRAEAKAVQVAATKILDRKRRDLDVVSASEFATKIGSGSFVISSGDGNLLTQALSGSQITKARAAGIGFVLMIQPNTNRITRDIDESSSTDTDYEYDSEGNLISCDTTTTYTTSSRTNRRVNATYHLYDLETKKQVWQTSSNHSETRSNSRCSSVCYPPAPGFPPPASTGDVMENMTAAAARKLPKDRFRLFAARN